MTERRDKAFWDAQPLGRMLDRELAEVLGCHVSSVTYQRHRRNIEPWGNPGRPAKTASGTPGRGRNLRFDDGEWDCLKAMALKRRLSIPDLIRAWMLMEDDNT